MTAMAMKQQDDPDKHKGAIEGDRPLDEQHWNPNADALNAEGLPELGVQDGRSMFKLSPLPNNCGFAVALDC